jgi:hypothetical protein
MIFKFKVNTYIRHVENNYVYKIEKRFKSKNFNCYYYTLFNVKTKRYFTLKVTDVHKYCKIDRVAKVLYEK